MKRIALLIVMLAAHALGCATFNVPADFLTGTQSSSSPSHKFGSTIIPQQAGDFWVNPTAASPFKVKDGSGNQRLAVETTHGLTSAGGGGTDATAAIGPLVTVPADAALYLLPNGTAASSTNYSIYSDGSTFLGFNSPSANNFSFVVAGATNAAQIKTLSGSQEGLWLGNNTYNSTNYAIDGDASTFVNFNFPSGGSFELTGAGSTFYQFVNATATYFNGTNGAALYYFDNSASAKMHFGTGATSAAIAPDTASGAGVPLSVTAGASGGTNAGAALTLGGGAHAGSSVEDGPVKVTTPFNGGYFTTTIAGNVTLTNAQSDANFVLLTSVSAGFTMTFTRAIADTSCVWIKNAGANSVTVAFLSGGTVSVANATSALICSDGSNLQKIMTGT